MGLAPILSMHYICLLSHLLALEKLYFSLVAILSIIALTGVHTYIKNKIGTKHDNGLLWVAAAFFIWFILGIYEDVGHDSSFYNFGRKVLSILNSVLLVYSLSYFRDSWYRVDKRFENFKFSTLALVTLLLCVVSFVFREWWEFIEGIISVLIAILLSSSMAATLFYRDARLLYLVPVFTGLLLIATQIFDSQFVKYTGWSPLDEQYNLALRMLSRPSLTFSFLLVALTWMGSKLEEKMILSAIKVPENVPPPGVVYPQDYEQEVMERTVSNEENQIVFLDKPGKFIVVLNIRTENIHLQNSYFDFYRNEKKYKFLKDCAQKSKTGESILRRDFPTENFEQEINRLLGFLNDKIARYNYAESLLAREDIFVKEDRGVYRLNCLPDRIQFRSIDG